DTLTYRQRHSTDDKACEPSFETTSLSEHTDPNLPYERQSELLGFGVFTEAEVSGFARVYYTPNVTQDRLYAALAPITERCRRLPHAEQVDFRGRLTDYVRLY